MTAVEVEVVGCGLCGGKAFSETVCTTKDFCNETCDNEFDYVRCADCGHIYLRNRPTLAELDTIYPKEYLTYDYQSHLGSFISQVRNRVQARRIRPIRGYAGPGDVIMDVGSGAGDLLMSIRRFGDPSWDLVGVDFSQAAITALERRQLRGIRARFETLDYRDKPVGVIIMHQLIEHVEDPLGSLRKAFELLRPGGVLVIETPNLESWDAGMFRHRYWGCWHAPRHWNLFTAQSLARAARKAGFDVAALGYTLCPFSWLHSVQYALRDRFGWERIGRKFEVNSLPLLVAASAIDVVQLAVTGRTSNMRAVLAKPQ